MRASVVICTYKRPESARKLLLELQRQTYKDFEVIVVSQGDRKDFERIKDSVETTYPVRYSYESIPNLPHARNIGIKETSGEIIIFLDDDIKPCNTLIATHLADYADLSIGMVGGRILGDKCEENVPDSKIGMVRRFDGFPYLGFHKNIRCKVMHVKATNMSLRKKIALEIDGFDERFKGTAEYEEMDFCLRVLKRGYKIIFDPTAVVEHYVLSTGGCRLNSKEESIYWLYRNHSLLFLNNLNRLFYPVLIVEYIARIILRSLRWRKPNVIVSGFRGIQDGWKAHFSKLEKRLW